MDIPRPHIVSFGSNDELRRFYPAEADKAGIEGTVIMRATLDETGRLTDARVVSESPPDMGFGGAASRLVQTFTYANPTGHPAEFAFKVKFDPKEPASAGDPEKS